LYGGDDKEFEIFGEIIERGAEKMDIRKTNDNGYVISRSLICGLDIVH